MFSESKQNTWWFLIIIVINRTTNCIILRIPPVQCHNDIIQRHHAEDELNSIKRKDSDRGLGCQIQIWKGTN
jgi:hypothetical protein